MIPISMKLIKSPPSAAKIFKQITFGHVVGITRTTKRGQEAVRTAARKEFTIRNKWLEAGPKSIKIRTASKGNPTGEIWTDADWLIAHEKGGMKTARRGRVAVPTADVRRNKRDIIQRSQRPRNLKNTFVMQTKHGPVLAQRIKRGKLKGIRILYGLEGSVRLKRTSVFFDPIDATVKRFLNHDIREGVEFAFKTMR